MTEPADEDFFPNDFDGLDFDNIPGLEAPTISSLTPEVSLPLAVAQNSVSPPTATPALSARSNSIEYIDPSFLAAVDALEARVLGEMPGAPGSRLRSEPGGHLGDTRTLSFNSPQGGGTNSLKYIREHSIQSADSAMRKGKEKAESREDIDVRGILAGYESELTCPICCDLLVGAQVANPCGHTCCGDCSYGWLAQNSKPTCAICRTRLSSRKPLLPNFSADNLVRQHLQALAKSGRPDWQERGYRAIEWNKRLESWKKTAAARTANESANQTTGRRRRWHQRYYEVSEYWPTDESIDDGGERPIPRVMSRRGTRPRR